MLHFHNGFVLVLICCLEFEHRSGISQAPTAARILCTDIQYVKAVVQPGQVCDKIRSDILTGRNRNICAVSISGVGIKEMLHLHDILCIEYLIPKENKYNND